MRKWVPSAAVVEELATLFYRNGYVRVPDMDRRAATPRTYKKGYEVRLVADTTEELEYIQHLLRLAGFEPGQPFAKAKQWRQPLYGRAAVERFLEMVGLPPEANTNK